MTASGISLIIVGSKGAEKDGIYNQLKIAPPVIAKKERRKSGRIMRRELSFLRCKGDAFIGDQMAVTLNRTE